jgi:hypothetical protein
MSYEIKKVDVWAGSIEDRPGGLSEKLEALQKAGANLEFVVARRTAEKQGQGVVFVTPLKGAKQTESAEQVGLSKSGAMHSLRLEGPDQPGLGARITRMLAEAGINLRGLSAAAVGGHCIVYFAFDSDDDAAKAGRVLKEQLGV